MITRGLGEYTMITRGLGFRLIVTGLRMRIASRFVDLTKSSTVEGREV